MRWRALTLVAGFALGATSGCQRWPPALTGLTVVALDAQGQPDLARVSRTLLGAPIPVIVVRPGPRPERPGLALNDPRNGRIHVTLARGTQHFCFYAAEWDRAERYLVGVFLDRHRHPAFAAVVAGKTWEQQDRALALDGRTLLPTLPYPYSDGSFRVTVDRIEVPIRSPAIDLTGPWNMRPDQIADLVGLIRLTVSALR